MLSQLLAQADTTTTETDGGLFGTVKAPPGVEQYDKAASLGGVENIGLLLFVSNILKLVGVAAGLFVVFNIIYAGIIYISSSGEASAHTKVRDQVTFSVVGLVIIVSAYAIAILIGLIFFGDPDFIINPTLCGPGDC